MENELEAQLQEIMQQNELLRKENELFEGHLLRLNAVDPEDEEEAADVRFASQTKAAARTPALTLSQRLQKAIE